MTASTHNVVGLDHVVAALARRYAFDDLGRIAGSSECNEGRTPRFVLGRAREGIVWRFRADLDPMLVVEIARLASREKGIPIDGESKQEPERLAAIVKRVGRSDGATPHEGHTPHPDAIGRPAQVVSAAPATRHEWVLHDGVVVGELWSID